ncbi:MAG: ATP-binding protein [Alphaproteobacteria bacterium]|nr:ATP-binding protein [Alphaproteobacteria bacterium]
MLPLARLEFCAEPKTGSPSPTAASATPLGSVVGWEGDGEFNGESSWAVVESPAQPAGLSEAGVTAELLATIRRTLSQLNYPCLESMVAARRIFALNLTTATAMATPVAPRFFAALKQRFDPAPPSREGGDQIEFCLTEVITNAIIHGNLGVNPLWSSSAAGAVAGCDHSRLTVLALLRQGLGGSEQLEIIVSDEGERFSTKFIPSLPFVAELLDNRSPRGRGLALIRELGVELGCVLGNNSVRLSFPWTS